MRCLLYTSRLVKLSEPVVILAPEEGNYLSAAYDLPHSNLMTLSASNWEVLDGISLKVGEGETPVSYTHLDVYKRQLHYSGVYQATYIRGVCQPEGTFPLFLSAVSGKPDPGDL